MDRLSRIRGPALLRCAERVPGHSHPRRMWPHGGGCLRGGIAARRYHNAAPRRQTPRDDLALRAGRGGAPQTPARPASCSPRRGVVTGLVTAENRPWYARRMKKHELTAVLERVRTW